MRSESAPALRPDGRSARLRRALVALATSPQDESRESNGPSTYSENLVVEFDEAYTGFVEGFDDLPSESQLLALQTVDTKLSAMVDAKDAALWTIRGYREDSRWTEVRALAKDALGEFGWPRTPG